MWFICPCGRKGLATGKTSPPIQTTRWVSLKTTVLSKRGSRRGNACCVVPLLCRLANTECPPVPERNLRLLELGLGSWEGTWGAMQASCSSSVVVVTWANASVNTHELAYFCGCN